MELACRGRSAAAGARFGTRMNIAESLLDLLCPVRVAFMFVGSVRVSLRTSPSRLGSEADACRVLGDGSSGCGDGGVNGGIRLAECEPLGIQPRSSELGNHLRVGCRRPVGFGEVRQGQSALAWASPSGVI